MVPKLLSDNCPPLCGGKGQEALWEGVVMESVILLSFPSGAPARRENQSLILQIDVYYI